MRGTANISLPLECGEMPLDIRRYRGQLRYAVKLKATPNLATSHIMQDCWENYYKKPNGSQSFFKIVEKYMSNQQVPTEETTISQKPPWHLKPAKVDLTLTSSVNKTDNKICTKVHALEFLEAYKAYTHIYTDGSKIANKTAAAFCIPKINVTKKYRLTDDTKIHTAELVAIKESLNWIIENKTRDKFIILSDSLSALQTIKAECSNSRPNLLLQILTIIGEINKQESDVVFAWIPSHVGIPGNEMADQLAKQATEENIINYVVMKEISDSYNDIEQHVLSLWQAQYDSNRNGRHYKSIEPTVSNKIKYKCKNRAKERLITRLRLGMCGLNKYLYKIGLHNNGNCENCGCEETVEHLLFNCTQYNINLGIQNICRQENLQLSLKTLLSHKTTTDYIYNEISKLKRDI